jgi:putative serine protease PepD
VAAVAAAVLVATGGTVGGVVGTRLADSQSTTAAPAAVGAVAVANQTGGTLTLAQIATAVSPSVVSVLVSGAESAEGSGIIVSADGRIVTNNHVVAAGGSAGRFQVVLSTGKTVDATVVSQDPAADLAILQATGVSGLTPATFGSSADLRVGDSVLAFGSPLGLAGTVTAGIVSAVGRSVQGETNLTNLIQTDASINPGSSGGALVDMSGKVVGINVAIATTGEDSGNIGVGFAIPIDSALATIDQNLN